MVGWPDSGARPDRQGGGRPKSRASTADAELVKALQEHVKRILAPYKYPRAIEFRAALPKTATGKLQRSALRAG